MFRYIDHNPHDKNYSFTISDGWGGKVYMTKEDLANLQKEIAKVLDKPAKV